MSLGLFSRGSEKEDYLPPSVYVCFRRREGPPILFRAMDRATNLLETDFRDCLRVGNGKEKKGTLFLANWWPRHTVPSINRRNRARCIYACLSYADSFGANIERGERERGVASLNPPKMARMNEMDGGEVGTRTRLLLLLVLLLVHRLNVPSTHRDLF